MNKSSIARPVNYSLPSSIVFFGSKLDTLDLENKKIEDQIRRINRVVQEALPQPLQNAKFELVNISANNTVVVKIIRPFYKRDQIHTIVHLGDGDEPLAPNTSVWNTTEQVVSMVSAIGVLTSSMEELGVQGEEVPEASLWNTLRASWNEEEGAVNRLSILSGQLVDMASILRNSMIAAWGNSTSNIMELPGIPTLMAIGGWVGTCLGAYMGIMSLGDTLKHLVQCFIRLSHGDFQGVVESLEGVVINMLSMVIGFGYMAFSLSMLTTLGSLEMIFGAAFYAAVGLQNLYHLVVDGYFQYQLRGKLKQLQEAALLQKDNGKVQEKLIEVLQFLKDKAEYKDTFIRRTNAGLYRHAQELEKMIADIKQSRRPDEIEETRFLETSGADEMSFTTEEADGDFEDANEFSIEGEKGEAVNRAYRFIEAVSKENYSKIFSEICYLIIAALGIVAVVCAPPLAITAILFAVGAALWLISGDMQIPKALFLKKNIVNALWNREGGYRDYFIEQRSMLKHRLDLCDPQSRNLQPIFAQNVA